ncbi:MAG: radical SAM protein [Candidatus Competibacteraceae bacterium]|nr:radical SAM protein [Candidatus Competibacteraceae bacterium]
MSKQNSGGTFVPVMPFHMVWLATNACNARCLHCSSNSAQRSADELATKEVYAMVDDFVEAGVVDLGISGGEPLIRKDLFQIIAFVKSRGMSVGVATNGAKLDRWKAEKLADLEINRLQISLDGLAEPHETLRCWPGLFERALSTIELAKNCGIRVHVCCTISQLNVDQLDTFVECVASLGVSRLNLSRFVPTGRGVESLDLPSQRWQEVIKTCVRLRNKYVGRLEIVSHLAQQILVDDIVTDMPGFIGCQAGRGQGCITANGTIFPCVLLPIPLGNIREASFRDIWQGAPVVQQLQDRSNLQGRCGSCDVQSRCGGCRAVAFAKTGQLFGDDPRCWLQQEKEVLFSH